jgi:citrate lyase subunit beta/citryl-CoA lyase
MIRTTRSLLFVPGHQPERFDKAVGSGAHEVILDLEDAVTPATKAQARDAVATWLAQDQTAMVRINAMQTAWFEDDIRLLQACPGASVMLAKADEASLKRTLAALPGRNVIALLETVAGYLSLRELAALPGLARIAFGSVDFATESGIEDCDEALTAVRTQIVLVSCHAGLAAPIDGVSLNFKDASLMEADARHSRRLGFGGKLCIHPNQVTAVNAAFQPTPEELAWAQRVLAAFEASGGAATAVDGKMVDKPVVDRARRLTGEAAVR